MSATWGNNFKITIFGESHGAGIGCVIDGLPAGIRLDTEKISYQMQRRRPGHGDISTSRKENDETEILSGIFEDRTTGTPLCAFIRNSDTRSTDYAAIKDLIRPGHADLTGSVKFKGFNDYRGGGHFSGRLTAALVFAGSVAMQFLEMSGVSVCAHIGSIGNISDDLFHLDGPDAKMRAEIAERKMAVIDAAAGEKMVKAIHDAAEAKDSVGGTVECAVTGLPAGIGEPFFDSAESEISHMMFAIPGVKGIEFGSGFALAAMNGSQANDVPVIKNSRIVTETNHNGGLNGGISNGMPVVFKLAFKPTASIKREQRTVDMEKAKTANITIEGRHDPCIVPRAVPVVECAAAIVIADLIMRDRAVRGRSRFE